MEGRVGNWSFTTKSHPTLVLSGRDGKSPWDRKVLQNLGRFEAGLEFPDSAEEKHVAILNHRNHSFLNYSGKNNKTQDKKIRLMGLLTVTFRGRLEFHRVHIFLF